MGVFRRALRWLRADRRYRVFWLNEDWLCIDDGFFRASMRRSPLAFGTSLPANRLAVSGFFDDEAQIRALLAGQTDVFRTARWASGDSLEHIFAYRIRLRSVRSIREVSARSTIHFVLETDAVGSLECELPPDSYQSFRSVLSAERG